MSAFDAGAAFLFIIGAAGWINSRFLRQPPAAVMLIAGLAGSGLLLLARQLLPDSNAAADLVKAIFTLNFPGAVLGYLLAFLLFAGGVQASPSALLKRLPAISSLATLGVLVSTALVAGAVWFAARGLGLRLPLAWAITFGALISPTDPVAVLAAVRKGGLNPTIKAVLEGEALFNDGVGIVLFGVAVQAASARPEASLGAAIGHGVVAALGGGGLGWAASALAVWALRAIDDYAVEVSLTIALACGVYAVAEALGLSGPIGVAVAGLMVGEHGVRTAMSRTSQRYICGFWSLINDILTAFLFLLLGLEVMVVPLKAAAAGLSAVAVLAVMASRLLIVWPWGAHFTRREGLRAATLQLVWGGLHGAVSLALALRLPASPYRETILTVTFSVVVFSVLAQGATFGNLIAWLGRAKPGSQSPPARTSAAP